MTATATMPPPTTAADLKAKSVGELREIGEALGVTPEGQGERKKDWIPQILAATAHESAGPARTPAAIAAAADAARATLCDEVDDLTLRELRGEDVDDDRLLVLREKLGLHGQDLDRHLDQMVRIAALLKKAGERAAYERAATAEAGAEVDLRRLLDDQDATFARMAEERRKAEAAHAAKRDGLASMQRARDELRDPKHLPQHRLDAIERVREQKIGHTFAKRPPAKALAKNPGPQVRLAAARGRIASIRKILEFGLAERFEHVTRLCAEAGRFKPPALGLGHAYHYGSPGVVDSWDRYSKWLADVELPAAQKVVDDLGPSQDLLDDKIDRLRDFYVATYLDT